MTLFQNASRRWMAALGLVVASTLATPALAQNQFQPNNPERFHSTRTANNTAGTNSNARYGSPSLSESTAILEAAIRGMYKHIEPGNDPAPDELLAYADLRALRLYAGALEVAGWSFEQSLNEYQYYQNSGAYRNGRGRSNDLKAAAVEEKYRAGRETIRTLLFWVRQTAVSVEHQVSFCDPAIAQEWREAVLPALRDTIQSTEPLLEEQVAWQYRQYGVPNQQQANNNTNVIPASTPANNGIPRDAVEVGKNPTYAPYDGQGRGQGRYFEVRTFGGDVHITKIRYRSHESSFGVLGTSVVRELPLDVVVEPGQPVFIPVNRRKWADLSELEIEWEPNNTNRKVFATLELVEKDPNDRN